MQHIDRVKSLLIMPLVLILGACGEIDEGQLNSVKSKLSDTDINVVLQQGPGNDAVSTALLSGNPADLPDSADTIVQRLLAQIADRRRAQAHFLKTIYGSGTIDYTPSKYTQLIKFFGLQGGYPLIIGNGGKWLAAATEQNGVRNAGFGSNVLKGMDGGNFESYQPAMKRLLGWLMRENNGDMVGVRKVRFLQVDEVTFEKSRHWLLSQFPDWDVVHCTDNSNLSECLTTDVNLVVAGSFPTVSDSAKNSALEKIKTAAVPMLYVHAHAMVSDTHAGKYYGDDELLRHMSLQHDLNSTSGNRWSYNSASWENYQQMNARLSEGDVKTMETLVNRLNKRTFSFNLANCVEVCIDDNNTRLNDEFLKAALRLRSILGDLDRRHFDLFNMGKGYKTIKLLVLLGDYYRSKVDFPINNLTDDQYLLLQSWYADHAVYNYRSHNPVQPDMGSFSRSDFSHITPTSKTIDYSSVHSFKAAGVYGLPGQTLKVTRLDSNSAVISSIIYNSLRSGSSPIISSKASKPAYNRPKYIKSMPVRVAPGETIYLTSPYGGPLQVSFSAGGAQVRLRFENIGLHPYWKGPEDDQRFATAMNAGEYDWAELVTPSFQVHSTLIKMRETMTHTPWGTAAELAEATMRYHHSLPNALGGRIGAGIDPIPEVMEHAQRYGWTMATLTKILHMNADRASCGYLCSGNPYDSFKYYGPTYHGGLHELGHSIQSFVLDGFPGHAGTNFYSYYSKSHYRSDTGNNPECQSLRFAAMYNTLKASRASKDPYNYMRSLGWNGWKEGVSLVLQMVMAAEHEKALDDGWNLIPLLHILERNFKLAVKTEELWEASKANLGFDQYTQSEAKAMKDASRNNFMLVGISFITKLDFSEFFTMWGLPVSDAAKAQVAGYRDAKLNVYNVSDTNFCYGLKDATPVE